jgi:hypothetical protein
MSETNPYQTPQSNLEEPPQPGNYQLNPDWDIGDVFKEAWELTQGSKLAFWGAFFIYIAIAIAINIPFDLLGKDDSPVIGAIAQIVSGLVTYPLGVGLSMMGIKRGVGLPVNAFMVFDYYPKTIPIFLLYLLMILMIGLGIFLLIIPGIYLAIAYSMAAPLMVEKNMRLWEALEASRKAIHKCWFGVFGLYIVIVLVLLVSMIPLGIGLIWTAPFISIVMGIVYRSLFGISRTI